MADKQPDFFTRFSKTLMGPRDEDLTPEELAQRNANRAKANSMANSASDGEFESFMGPPKLSGGGGGGGGGLQDIAAIVMKLFA